MRRTSWRFTTECCGRTLYRGQRPPTGLIRCSYCRTVLPPASSEMLGSEEGTCSRGHSGAIGRDTRGGRVCRDCAAEATRRWREKADA